MTTTLGDECRALQTSIRETSKITNDVQEKIRDHLCSGKNGAEIRKLYTQIDELWGLFFVERKITSREYAERENSLHNEIERLLGG